MGLYKIWHHAGTKLSAMKNILTTLLCLLAGSALMAQSSKIAFNGTIEYTKTINIHAISKHEIGPKPDPLTQQMYDEYKKTRPQFITLKSTLVFDKNKTLFTPIPPTERIYVFQNNPMGTQFNTIYSDHAKKELVMTKQVYSDQLLIQDSTRKITWRLTDETRDIAGYTCRRANGLYMDSVSLVAFYTDKIRVNGGPESFSGLPGMILSLVIPHENVRFDATKVTLDNADEKKIVPPKSSSKPINYKQVKTLLQGMVKNWGPTGLYEMKVLLL